MPDPSTQDRTVAGMIAQARSLAGVWNELRPEDGDPRQAWLRYFECLGGMKVDELSARWEDARRLLRENGVSYNVYADPRGADRPWQLDAIPQPMLEEEWHFLSKGVEQRARVLEATLADIYGPQRTLLDGILPAALVHANPGFLLPLHGADPKGGWLHSYACELARDLDGKWTVIADRTQAPAGSGYVLENRIAMSRAFPEVYRAARVRRLANHFARVRRYLQTLGGRDNPHVVLLTPGPFSETYFEHAYISRYLGFTLAEGGDLAVRDEKVFLKTLAGLQQVDVILRRMDDDFCDPLELRGESGIGVPGLVQAVRAGNVVVANAMGSGVVEGAAFLGYIPDLCRSLLGEEPILPSVESIWCGEPGGIERAMEAMEGMVLKPSFPSLRAEPVFGDRLGDQGRQIMSERIGRDPEAWTAQGLVPMSGTVEWSGNHFRSRAMALRLYACRTEAGFDVLPGGLARVSGEPGRANIALRAGGGSKDLWIMCDDAVAETSLLSGGKPLDTFRRSGIDVPSRVADNLFWLGRYQERAEGISRLSRVALARLSGESGPLESGELGLVMAAMRSMGILGADPPSGRYGVEGAEHEVVASVFRSERPMGLQQTLSALHQAGFQVRDRVSNDTWRILHHLGRDFSTSRKGGSSTVGEVLGLLDSLLLHLSALAGMAKENTTRGLGWRFLDLGRRLERCQFTLDLIDVLDSASADGRQGLEAVLEILDSSITYRSRYFAELRFAQSMDLILVDETNPRSLLFQMMAVQRHLDALPRLQDNPFPRKDQALTIQAVTDLRLLDFAAIARDPAGAERERLMALLARMRQDLPVITDCLTRAWLSHAETTRQLARGA